MRPYGTSIAVACMVGIMTAQAASDLQTRLESLAAATGDEYLAARNQLVATASNALPQLCGISTNGSAPWHMRVVAGIVAERIMRGGELEALVQYDWKKDPDYDVTWEESHAGPVLHLSPLVTKRCIERRLWWYYMEVVWKETKEHAKTPRMPADHWRSAYKGACRASPMNDLILKITEERILNDIGFNRWETRGDLAFIENSKTNSVLPFLLEILPRVPVTDERNREWRVREWLNTLAQPQDATLVEDYYQKRGSAVPDLLRPQLKALKDRAGQAPVAPK